MAGPASTFEAPKPTYQLVDAIPEVAEARQLTRNAAEQVLSQRRQSLQLGVEAAALPLQVDALSTAVAVHEAESIYGKDSPEREERWQGLILDCGRLLQEWYRKKKAEYFEPVRQYYDDTIDDFFSHGLAIGQMTHNALTPIPDNPEEEARRVNEHVEHRTPRIVRGLAQLAVGRKAIRTVSECTDKAIEDYWSDLAANRPHTGYNGYVPEIEKVMIRDIRLDEDSQDRFEEQVGLSGLYITHDIIKLALERRNVPVGHMDKMELHGSQLLVDDDLMEFVAYLDAVASEQWCTEVFMGEEVPVGATKDYAGFRQEALRRKEYLEEMTQTLAVYVWDLAGDPSVKRHEAPAKVETFVKSLLKEIGKRNFVVAEQMFDTATARGLQQVVALEAQGRWAEAFALEQKVMDKAPGGGSCGGAACGLEDIDPNSDEGRRLALLLDAQPGDRIKKDKKRSCKKCGKNSIAYAYNSQKVNKHCGSCGTFESVKVSVDGAK